jgi:DNA-binding IclR family transcriptional regulator
MPRPSPQTDRVVGIINLLSERLDGASLTEIARALGARPTTLQHVLAALTSAGYLVREPSDRRYRLGPGLVQPGRIAATQYPALTAARAQMDQLSRELERPCYAFMRDGNYARLVHYTWDLRHPVPSLRVGELVPIIPPLGAVFVAWSKREAVERWFSRDPDLDPAEATRLRQTLVDARKLGFVVESQPQMWIDDEILDMLRDQPSPRRDAELRHRLAGPNHHLVAQPKADADYRITSIGAPIFEGSGAVFMSLSVAGFDRPVAGSEVMRIGERLRSAADAASADLLDRTPPT